MSLEFLIDELKTIKYAAVTMKLKQIGQKYQGDSEVTGLLLGMQPLVENDTALSTKEDIYIWLMNGENCHMIHTKYYEVVCIYIGKQKTEYQFPGKDSDLKIEDSRLKAIQHSMKAANRTSTNGLIDITTYEGIPESIKLLIGDKKDVTKTKVSNQHNRSGASNYSPASGHNTRNASGYTTYKKKEVSTLVFKRTTKYNVADAIQEMWSKIEEIQAGTYEAPKLRPFKEEKKKEASSNSPTTNEMNDIDDFYGYGYMW